MLAGANHESVVKRVLLLALAACVLWLAPQPDAYAVLTTVAIGSAPRSLTLRVGALSGIDEVVFDVTGAAVSPTPVPVSGSTAVDFVITTNRASGGFEPFVTLNADSSAGLACVPGSGCGSTVIPFSTISWTSTNSSTSGLDVQDGSFTGSASQQLARFQSDARTCPTFGILCSLGLFAYNYYDTNLFNRLLFTYSNSTLYPAGQYKGRVVFTATML